MDWKTHFQRASRSYHVDFGENALGYKSVADVQDLLNSCDYRITQIGQSYTNVSPNWVNSDPAAFVEWTNDWNNLQNRYNGAKSSAQSTIEMVKLNPLVSYASANGQSDYDAIMKAIRQCYPPDGCPSQKGDMDDLINRLQSAGATIDFSQIPQPTAPDQAQAISNALQPGDVIGNAGTGNPFDLIAFFKTHWQWLVGGAAALLGIQIFMTSTTEAISKAESKLIP